jgi:O-antigen/teichoic acid export membrane protein
MRLVLFAVVVQGIFYLRNIVVLPIFTRCLGEELFGVWSKMHALINMAVPLTGLGLVAGIHRFLPSADQERRGRLFGTALSVIAIGSVAFTIVIVSVSPMLAPLVYVSDPQALSLPILLAVAGVLGVASLSPLTLDYFRFTDRPLRYGVGVLLQVSMLSLAAGLGWAWLGRSLWVPILAWGSSLLLTVAWCLRRIRIELNFSFDRNAMREMMRFGIPFLPLGILVWALQTLDRYMLSWLLPEQGDQIVGVYAANYSMAGLIAMVFSPFFLFYLPAAARLWDGNQIKQLGSLTRQSVKYALVFAVPVLVAAPVLGDSGLRLLAGPEFRADTSVIVCIMIGVCLHQLSAFAETPLTMQKRTGLILVYTVAAVVVNSFLNWILIPQRGPWGGLTGAALASALASGVWLILNIIGTRRVAGFSLGWSMVVRIAIAATPSAFLAWNAQPDGVVQVALTVLAGGSLYAGLLFATRVCLWRDVLSFVAALKGLISSARELAK